MSGRVVLCEGDITAAEVDAIVNAANSALVLGSGVAGAIREQGGAAIQAECDAHGPIEVGEAAMTTAGQLPCRFVVHAAAMELGGAASEASVRSALRASFVIAREKGCRTLACPALGTGVGGLGMQRCAEISLEEARAHLEGETSLEEIRFVLFGEPAFRVFEMAKDAAAVEAQMKRLRERR